ncbi:Z1 domain-containing protein [Porphyromonas loveana]|uniref:Z1 domain-containing protein n=1 Tax=Porphyromonas loveana TaxID=1884669 RepID=UPI00359FCA18
MASIIEVVKNTQAPCQIKMGDRTISFMESQSKLNQDGRDLIMAEAVKILRRCIPPGEIDNITNIALGYVQSGKTLSFTTLTALAADNGYRIVIYLTGTKNNLQRQTAERLKRDLNIDGKNRYYAFITTDSAENEIARTIKNHLEVTQEVLLIPILKHYSHINKLSMVFNILELTTILGQYGALIIDDEADQSSFNTYAKKNSRKPDWEEDDFSKTYASILALKKSLPSHSYIQYTATPQAAFLIDSNDILSPVYHTVLTPGEGYTGGKYFFKERKEELVSPIPDEQIYHHRDNRLSKMPISLGRALKEFLLSVAIVVNIQEREPFLSMMIHIDGLRDTNKMFYKWVSAEMQKWINFLRKPEDDPVNQAVKKDFESAYDSITRYMKDTPPFDDVIKDLCRTMTKVSLHLVQSGGKNTAGTEIPWNDAPGHILIGADMLNRGFTIERLSMSYMPRTTKGKSNADTIEQRCRFFGYKINYIDVCRVYLSEKSISEYESYVEHEEALRASLSACASIEDFSKIPQAMLLAETLNPTRKNILSSDLVRNKLSGWKQMISCDYIEENQKPIRSFLTEWSDLFNNEHDYDGNIMRNHRSALISIDDFVRFFKGIVYGDVPNITRRNVTIQYLIYLRDVGRITHVRLYEMAYLAKNIDDLRSHKPGVTNIQFGRAENGSYPGDKEFKNEETVCFQLHHYRIEEACHPLNRKDVYNFCVYYPESLANSFVMLAEEGDDMDED